jgi:hypothetical protein
MMSCTQHPCCCSRRELRNISRRVIERLLWLAVSENGRHAARMNHGNPTATAAGVEKGALLVHN